MLLSEQHLQVTSFGNATLQQAIQPVGGSKSIRLLDYQTKEPVIYWEAKNLPPKQMQRCSQK